MFRVDVFEKNATLVLVFKNRELTSLGYEWCRGSKFCFILRFHVTMGRLSNVIRNMPTSHSFGQAQFDAFERISLDPAESVVFIIADCQYKLSVSVQRASISLVIES